MRDVGAGQLKHRLWQTVTQFIAILRLLAWYIPGSVVWNRISAIRHFPVRHFPVRPHSSLSLSILLFLSLRSCPSFSSPANSSHPVSQQYRQTMSVVISTLFGHFWQVMRFQFISHSIQVMHYTIDTWSSNEYSFNYLLFAYKVALKDEPNVGLLNTVVLSIFRWSIETRQITD